MASFDILLGARIPARLAIHRFISGEMQPKKNVCSKPTSSITKEAAVDRWQFPNEIKPHETGKENLTAKKSETPERVIITDNLAD